MPAVLIDVNLFWQIINFLVLILIFKIKLFKPVSKIISERRDKINKDIEDAEKDKEVSSKLKTQAEAELKRAKAEVIKMLIEAEKKSEERAASIMKEAHAQREKMIKTGEAEMEKQKEAAMKELQVYARNLISDFTEKLVSDKTSSTLIDEAIDKVGEE
jgi:F-type H+-transporting ATPase subunit b